MMKVPNATKNKIYYKVGFLLCVSGILISLRFTLVCMLQ